MRNVIGEFCFREQSQDFEGPIWALGNGGSCLSVDYSTGSAGLIGFLLSSVEHPLDGFPFLFIDINMRTNQGRR